MAYIVIKRIKGRAYRYLQRSWRDGKRVRTRAICLGPVGRVARKRKSRHNREYDPEEQQRLYGQEMARLQREDEAFERWQRETFGETAHERSGRERQEHLDHLHDAYGLKLLEP